MHKKHKLSVVEKHLVRRMIRLFLIQVLIILVFVQSFDWFRPIDVQETKQADITVEEILTVPLRRGTRGVVVVADSTEYFFSRTSTSSEYSNRELLETLSVGDYLSLLYREGYVLFGTGNLIVDARSETEVYRSLEEYNRSKEGLEVERIILFSLIELIFLGYVSVRCDITLFKALYKKIRRNLKV